MNSPAATLVGDGIENPGNALTMLNVASTEVGEEVWLEDVLDY